MKEGPQWPTVVRLAWLTGGLVAISEPGQDAVLRAGAGGPPLLSVPLGGYAAFMSELSKTGTEVVGVTFIQDIEEMQGLRPPEFRLFFKGFGWLFADTAQSWREIVHHAAKANEMDLMDVASRISSLLRDSEQRMLALAKAYSTQLSARARANEVKEYVRFRDLHSQAVYLAIHAMFWELAVLRDTLAEFSAKFAFRLTNVTKWGGLMKNPKLKRGTDHHLSELRDRLEDANNPAGWVSVFTAYRNFFTHNAPMQEAAGMAFSVQDLVPYGDIHVPNVYYALPAKIHELTAARKYNEPLYRTFEELVESSRRDKPTRERNIDALQYLHQVAMQFGLLARDLIHFSPVKASPIELTDKDLIGPVKVIRGAPNSVSSSGT